MDTFLPLITSFRARRKSWWDSARSCANTRQKKKAGTDAGTDFALLKIDEKNLPAITFADSEKARAGDVVLAVGNPFGLRQTVTMGIISAIGRGGVGIVDYENFIQTDAAINM